MGTSLSAEVDARPDQVFATLTDPARLPTWNSAIRRLVEAPETLTEDAEWVVEMHALGRTWHSRSRVEVLDGEARVFRYRSQTDDGNPSSASWRWSVEETRSGGTLVTVSVQLQPKTFWRRVLLVHVRRRQLASQELPRSLASLSAASKASFAGG